MWSISIRLALLVSLSLYSGVSLAASCCGGGVGDSRLMLGEEKLQLAAEYSRSVAVARAYRPGEYLLMDGVQNETRHRLTLAGAYRFGRDWQGGLTTPIVFLSQEDPQQSSHFAAPGDASGFVGYELASVTRGSSPWPKVLSFIEGRVPTGRSIYEAELESQADVTGKGLYGLKGGVLFSRGYRNWDYAGNLFAEREFSRTFDLDSVKVTLAPGWGLGAGVSAGYSPEFLNRLRAGLAFNVRHEFPDSVQIGPVDPVEGLPVRVWTTTVSLALLATEQITIAARYSDQTLLGTASNSTLSRAVGLELVHRRLR